MALGLQSSRRNFLVGMGRFAAAAEVVRLLPGSAIAAEAAGTGGALCPPPSAWSDLARGVSGGVLRPEDPFFADVCRPNNLRYGATLPAGIARCVTASDVQSCVRWVKDQAMPFAVRSGGHNYAGFSTTPGLLIDMSKMAGAEPVAGKDGLVRVLGGTINSLVYKQMERLGRTITHGRCDTVGAAGFLLGGGIGFNMRKFGMASDLLRATELVTADGSLVDADADRDSALYWACRGGGGGNFGINTSFTLETRPAEPVTVFNLTWTTDLPRVLKLLLTELAAAPDEFGSKISVTIPSWQERCDKVPLSLSVLGQLHTSKATLKDIFASTWELADQRVVKENVPYWQGQDFLTETTFPYYYQEKSSYMTAARITDEAIAAMFDWAARMPATSMPVSFKFFQVGGAIDRMEPTATAYVHRGYDWLFTIEANWWRPTDSVLLIERALEWQQRFYDDVNRRTGAAGAFQNFPDPSLADWQRAYYGENLARLAQVKAAVDPAMLFTFAQAIRPA
ncbi:FAD-linked oxidase [Azospirillum thiophilum]|uniref:FAD-linked oxidase n=1 Tax=Azospirillum thiophilum TaxID=528244 RepID=A0AAC8ZV00_9PROT|nr:FAD-binding oxidoreductase [Azospirillum thiophilum]ALG73149.1 FAD-linked oxidase [Azospirillum thiophilum]KJR64424.1 FAD-linked oxidase [Azospirillum thiophilum]